MKKKRRHSRREFIEGALAAGAAFAFAKLARAAQNGSSSVSFGTPLSTERIPQPDDGFCSWVGFSPVNDQAAFVSGLSGETCLYTNRVDQPEKFDVLWKPSADLSAIRACAWSPNGEEIAFLVQQVNEKVTPKSGRISIYVVDVASKEVREPVVIAESVGKETTRYANVSYKIKDGLTWWNESCICVLADKTSEAAVLKFDTHTGQPQTLIPAQDGVAITSIASTRSGELRFVKNNRLDPTNGSQPLVCGMTQDGSIHDYSELTKQQPEISNARISQDGEFVFVEKRDTPPKSMPMLNPVTCLIYKIETHTIIGQISLNVYQKNDIYTYLPLTVRNDKELILIEIAMLTVDGGGPETNTRMKAVKIVL